MKAIVNTLLFILLTGIVQAQQSFNMKLLGTWNDTTLSSMVNPYSSERQFWNDLIGWTNPVTGKEFIIMGSIDSTYFFDVSDPANIKKCASYDGKVRSINRDYDVYKNYVYAVSDNGAPGAFQIFDLQYLPDSVHLVLEDTSIATNVHSIYVDSVSKRLYFNSARKEGNHSAMLILSLENPENPTVIGELKYAPCNTVHEAFFRNDTAYCSCGYDGFYVFNMQRADSITYIGGIVPPYPYNGYNHTSWLNDDGTLFVFTDEYPTGLPIKLYSIDPNKRDYDFELTFNSHAGATAHNVIWLGNKLWTSAYEDGMVLWDMSNPYTPQIDGFYDTYPQNKNGMYNGLTGCWGVYPFFASGNIAASDMHNGLFMLKHDKSIQTGANELSQKVEAKVFPNPFTNELTLALYTQQKQTAQAKIYNLNGQLLLEKQIDLHEGENALKLEEVSALSSGMYLLQVITSQNIVQQPIVKY
jgi:choice-of-anchor B domain-containing protein